MKIKQNCFLCNKASLECVCEQCEKSLYNIEKRCLSCATILNQTTNYCGQCLRKPPVFNRAYTLFSYNNPIVSYLIKHFKYHDKLFIGKFFAKKLDFYIKSVYKDKLPLIIAMPIHKNRTKIRGFNQVIELLPNINNPVLCKRIKATPSFTTLKLKERKQFIKNAFQCNAINSQHILLVDDVMTTGTSFNELAKAMIKTNPNIEKIDAISLARA